MKWRGKKIIKETSREVLREGSTMTKRVSEVLAILVY